MKEDPSELLKEALKLPPEARAAFAGSLLDSLDHEVDEEVEAAWHAEINRRLVDIDSGKVKLIPRSEARRRIARW